MKGNFVDVILNERIRWNGRYFSNFLVIGSLLNIGGITLYQFMPGVLISFVLFCTHTVFRLTINTKNWLFALVSTTIYFSVMPALLKVLTGILEHLTIYLQVVFS